MTKGRKSKKRGLNGKLRRKRKENGMAFFGTSNTEHKGGSNKNQEKGTRIFNKRRCGTRGDKLTFLFFVFFLFFFLFFEGFFGGF